MDRTPLAPDAARAALAALPDWRARLGALRTAYRCATPAAALELVAAVGALAEEVGHHPDVDWRYDHVFVTCTTWSAGTSVTALDVDLAGRVSALAAARGAEPLPALPRQVEVAVDTADPGRVREVWARALGYEAVGEEDLVDPHRRGPSVWFQVTPTPSANRLHLDVSVAAEVAADVVASAAAAGARVDDGAAPAFTVLSDADGDRICVCTPEGRDDPTR